MPAIVIGRRTCSATITALKPHEAAFVLRRSEADIKNMLRRGERYARAGESPETIVTRGALPVARIAGKRCADIASVALAADGDELALVVLACIVERRLRAPRASMATESAPDLITVINRL